MKIKFTVRVEQVEGIPCYIAEFKSWVFTGPFRVTDISKKEFIKISKQVIQNSIDNLLNRGIKCKTKKK